MKIGLYFGSFNPVHIGHLIIASYVAQHANLHKVWLVVSPQNPLKPSRSLLNEYHRLHLAKVATDDDPLLEVSDVEFKLPKPSYTIDTLTYLQEKYPQHSFAVVMGSDSLNNLHKWKNSELLLKNYSFLVYQRPGFPPTVQHANIEILKAPLLDISATAIRQMIAEGKSVRYLVPDAVREEIENNSYYKNL